MSEQAETKTITGKLILGLTGNIATGKSAVLRLADERGALTIDADKLVHRLMDSDEAIQKQVTAAFGAEVQREDGRIDRKALGNIVFDNKAALLNLEAILHPAVRRHIFQQIDESDASIIMVEAIKLLEGDLADACHQIWVTRCSQTVQMERLRVCRGLDTESASMRIRTQSPQEEKVAMADVVIETDGLLADTERRFELFWSRLPNPATVKPKDLIIPPATTASMVAPTAAATETSPAKPKAKLDLSRLKGAGAKLQAKREREKVQLKAKEQEAPDVTADAPDPTPVAPPPLPAVDVPFTLVNPEDRPADLEVRRARPSDIPSILLLIHKATNGAVRMKRSDLMMALSERSYFIGQVGVDISAVFGWSIESGVTKIDQIYIHPPEVAGLTGPALIDEIGKSAFQHMCELLVVFLPQGGPQYLIELFESQDYRVADMSKMVGSWRQAIEEAQPPNTDFLIKILAGRESHPI